MSQPVIAGEQQELEKERESLAEERRKLEEERRIFQREKEEFLLFRDSEEKRLKQKIQLFDMKWQILEKELVQLAKEKQDLAEEKECCRRMKAENQSPAVLSPRFVGGEIFFSGVDSELGMKKRYKDLLKIFHPDNRDGDTLTLQVINREYDEMKKQFLI